MDLTVFTALFEVLTPIILIVLIGFWFQKSTGVIDTPSTCRLVMMVGAPSLVFSSLTTTALPIETLLSVSLGAACVCAFAIVLALVLLALFKLPVRTYLPPHDDA